MSKKIKDGFDESLNFILSKLEINEDNIAKNYFLDFKSNGMYKAISFRWNQLNDKAKYFFIENLNDKEKVDLNELLGDAIISNERIDIRKLFRINKNNRKKSIDQHLKLNQQNIVLEGIKKSIEISKNCESEDNNVHPKVGVVIIKNNEIIQNAYRGENAPGDHAEYTALVKKKEKLNYENSILITTLEPCTRRSTDKIPCAERIVNNGIKEVWIGIIDPNPKISGKGVNYLIKNNVKVEFFPFEFAGLVLELNKSFWDNEWKKYKRNLMEEVEPEFIQKYENSIEQEFFIPKRSKLIIFESLREKLNMENLKTLCELYLDIKFDELPGGTLSGKIREIILYYERRNSLIKLFNSVNEFDRVIKLNIFKEKTILKKAGDPSSKSI